MLILNKKKTNVSIFLPLYRDIYLRFGLGRYVKVLHYCNF